MYELDLTNERKEKFKAKMKYELRRRRMTMIDLANEINRPVATVYNFMYNKSKPNRFIAAEIANYLGITNNDF